MRNMAFTKSALAAIAALALVSSASAQTGSDTETTKAVQTIIAAHHGKVALYARQLNTGKVIAVDAELPVQTASTIKLAMLWEATRQVALGSARWDEKRTLAPGEGVAGSGILHFFDTPMQLSLKDIATMMVIVSDNTATNLMIDRFTTRAVDDDMAAIGLPNTFLYKKVFKPAEGPMPADQKKFGLGKTTPHEIAAVMERIGRCDLNVPGKPPVDQAKADAACAVSIDMLRNQFYRETIPRYLETLDSSEKGSGIASKTGSLDATRSDVAIVAAKTGPIVLAIYTYENKDHGWTVDNEGEMTIAKVAEAIVKAWSPSGIDGKSLIPGLGIRK